MTTKTNIQAGYKDSSVGIIPQEWEVASLGKLVSITSGESPSLFNLREIGKYPYIKVEDMNNCEKYQLLSREYTDDERCAIQKGSIIFPKRGAAITNNKVRIAACQLYMDSNMMAIMPNDFVCGDYLYFKITYEQLFRIADTSTIPQINNKHIIPYKICLPPLAEQRKIAEILGVWDEAIEKQSRLIEKLELRKRGLMQRLLTGRIHLPGFTTPWQKRRMKDCFEHITDTSNGCEYLPMTISARLGLISQKDKFDRVIAGDSLKKYTHIQKGDFAYNKGNSNLYEMGCIYRLKEQDAVVPFVYICFRPKQNVIGEFYQHFFINHGLDRQLKRIITSGARGDGLLNVDKTDFFELEIVYPPIAEQKAIAEVLTAVDNEIAIHRKKLDSLRMQKRGLMQQLLTGKIRVKNRNYGDKFDKI